MTALAENFPIQKFPTHWAIKLQSCELVKLATFAKGHPGYQIIYNHHMYEKVWTPITADFFCSKQERHTIITPFS